MEVKSLINNTYNSELTVKLSYSEMQKLEAGLKCASNTDKQHEGIYAEIKFLYDMMKHGSISDNTIKLMYDTHKS